MKYPNQRSVEISKPTTFTSNFAIYGKDAMATACKVLNGSGFKVWCYLLSNSKQNNWNISPAHAEATWGISRSSFSDGLNELREKGFYDNDRQVIHHESTKNIDEIQKKKRNQESVEIRTRKSTKFEKTQSEKGISNNINSENTIDANASTNNNLNKVGSCASTRTNHPKEERKFEYDFGLNDKVFNF